jgi:hypothetical protein
MIALIVLNITGTPAMFIVLNSVRPPRDLNLLRTNLVPSPTHRYRH